MKKTLDPTEGIHYRDNLKGELSKPWFMTLPGWFRFPTEFTGHWEQRHVKVSRSLLQIEPEFVWNYANAFPDFGWVRVPSMAHDALLAFREAMIRAGIITEGGPEDNALKEDIDTVFILLSKERLPKWARLTPRLLFVFVNRLSKLAPGSQADDHRIRFVR